MKIAFIGYQKQEKYNTGTLSDEDQILFDFLTGKGLNMVYTIWNDPNIDWKQFDGAVLKSPWDYHEQFTAFNVWLKHIESLNIQLLNPYEIVRWNSDKHYLKEIAGAGLAVIDSVFFEKGTRPDLHDFFGTFSAQQLVIKPCVSASAKHTMVVNAENVTEMQMALEAFLSHESFMIQPFVEEILGGELSFIFLGNVYSHSVIKLPKAGDFRVQHFHGGTIKKFEPTAAQIASAHAYVEKFAPGCLYARVDGLMIKNRFELMELELIEPYLFLDRSEGSYIRYYEALVKLLKNFSKKLKG